MKRSIFILLSAIVSWVFGLIIMISPGKLLSHLTSDVTLATKLVMQWVGICIFSIGWMNFICRNAHGSKSLKAVMGGNIILHVLWIGFDIVDYSYGFIFLQGLVVSGVIHVLLAGGFAYYLIKMKETTLMSSSRRG